jgi:protein SCO1/2
MSAKSDNGETVAASDAAIVSGAGELSKGKGTAQRVLTSPWIWMAIVTLGFSIVFLINLNKRKPPELPRLGQIPLFTLTDQQGHTVTGDSYQGKVWIADFVFLGCQQSCPTLTTRMHDLQQSIEKEQQKNPIRFVSFSVDPANDTPQRLHDYAVKFKANEATWSFLTGQNEDVDKIVVQGFKMQYGRTKDEATGVFDIMHGDWFILVDGKGIIRGYYDSSDAMMMDKLAADAKRLAAD